MAQAFGKYERAIADSQLAAHTLGVVLLQAQAARAVSPISGRKILSALTQSKAGLDQALDASSIAHRLMETMARGMGIDPSAYGEQKPPEPNFAPRGRSVEPATVS